MVGPITNGRWGRRVPLNDFRGQVLYENKKMEQPEKQKQITRMYKRIESKENVRTLWMATGSFVFLGLVLYHSLDLQSWHNLVCERPVNSRLVSFHFLLGTGGVCVHRLTQPNLKAFVFTHSVRRYRRTGNFLPGGGR